jgi:hypothetical protein
MINNYQKFLEGKGNTNIWKKAKQKEYTTDALNKIYEDLTTNFEELKTRNSITLRYMGLVINLGADNLKLSNAGETFIRSSYKQKILDEQLMKVYLDSPALNNNISIKLAPMEVLLNILHSIDHITFEEYILFVCWINDKSEIPTVLALIDDYRKATDKSEYQEMLGAKSAELEIGDFADNVKRFFDMLAISSYIKKDADNTITSNISKEDIEIVLESFSSRDFSEEGYFEYLTTNNGWQLYSTNPNYIRIIETLEKKSLEEQEHIVNQIVGGVSNLPDLESVKPQSIEIEINPVEHEETHRKHAHGLADKIDFAERDAANRMAGDFAEQVVIKYEKESLITAGKNELANKVTQVSLDSDSYGYDVVSYDPSGEEKHIEVKAVKSKPTSSFRFFISENEISIARNDKNYHLYIVFDYLSESPLIYRMPNPFLNDIPGVTIRPMKYWVMVEIKK